MPYADEIRELAARSDLVKIHFYDSHRGHLTAKRILADADGAVAVPGQVSVFL